MYESRPQFLIIGAMKAGTTSIYHDLNQHPDLYLPPVKEPEDLISPFVETPDGKATYFAKFKNAPKHAICGEASTAYSKRPLHEGVAERAKHVLGPQIRIVYIIRDPLERAISQFRHQVALGEEARGIEQALLSSSSYSDFSRYAWQLEPWIDAFGPNAIAVVRFEDYIRDPQSVVDTIFEHIGVPQVQIRASHKNPSHRRRIAKPGSLGARLMRSSIYQHNIKPHIPSRIHSVGKLLFLAAAKQPDIGLQPATRKRFLKLVNQA